MSKNYAYEKDGTFTPLPVAEQPTPPRWFLLLLILVLATLAAGVGWSVVLLEQKGF